MKKLLLLSLLCSTAFAPAAYAGNTSTDQAQTNVLFAVDSGEQLITYLAQDRNVQNMLPLQDLKTFDQIPAVLQDVVLLRATGLQVTSAGIEKLKKIEEKLVELASTLSTLVKMGDKIKAENDKIDMPLLSAQEAQAAAEQVLIALMGVREAIELCLEENVVQTVQIALEIVEQANVTPQIKKAFVERVMKAHANNNEVMNAIKIWQKHNA